MNLNLFIFHLIITIPNEWEIYLYIMFSFLPNAKKGYRSDDYTIAFWRVAITKLVLQVAYSIYSCSIEICIDNDVVLKKIQLKFYMD